MIRMNSSDVAARVLRHEIFLMFSGIGLGEKTPIRSLMNGKPVTAIIDDHPNLRDVMNRYKISCDQIAHEIARFVNHDSWKRNARVYLFPSEKSARLYEDFVEKKVWGAHFTGNIYALPWGETDEAAARAYEAAPTTADVLRYPALYAYQKAILQQDESAQWCGWDHTCRLIRLVPEQAGRHMMLANHASNM